MGLSAERAVAIVGLGAVMPDAGDSRAFWDNIRNKRYSVTETPPERWRPELYYDPDPVAPDKTYSKIGAWVRGFKFDWKQHRIPPKVAAAMDEGQQWAVTIAAEALADFGYPERPLDTERTGVILGTAIGGEQHYITALRIMSPELVQLLDEGETFRGLPEMTRKGLLAEWRQAIGQAFPEITEDTMPGELPNIIAGRVANVLNLRGPNFIADAACASSFAAIASAVEMLAERRCDAIIAGGVDRNMGPSSFVKFCKIGALSATGTRPFGEGADGFVMGEGAAAFLLKRLADAEAAGDKIYGVIRGVGGSSDGKGKGITAPNPVGQVLATRRAWENAGLNPATATLVEAHGTSTKVGDVTEVESLSQVFAGAGRGAIALGSVKSNIGHLKAGAGAAGLLKTVWAIHERLLPPTLNARPSNSKIDFAATPFHLNHELREWPAAAGQPRRAGVSAYGFGGTNFHLVLEEYVPGMLRANGNGVHAGVDLSVKSLADASVQPIAPAGAPPDKRMAPDYTPPSNGAASSGGRLEAVPSVSATRPAPLQGIFALSAPDMRSLNALVEAALLRVESGWTPPRALPTAEDIAGSERLVIDFADRKELADRLAKALKAIGLGTPAAWRPLTSQGIFRGSGPKPGKIAFLFPGQGSQTLNMARKIAGVAPSVAAMFAEADEIMKPILGRPLSRYVWVDATEPEAIKRAEDELCQTAITQPAMLTVDAALQRLLADYGFRPDYVMGHSLGEYAALVAAGAMPFAHALEATAARGQEMTRVSVGDPGWMAAVIGPFEVVDRLLKEIDGYVVAANLNSHNQTVIGGATEAVKAAIERFNKAGLKAMRIPVSHAFHTQIVASASRPMRQVLDRLSFSPPRIPVIANVTGELYPSEPERIKDYLERQIASPVQWSKGLETLYDHGVRLFMEVGPKKVLKGFVDNVLNGRPDLVSLFTNHPDFGEIAMFNQAICGLYAAGYTPVDALPNAAAASPVPAVSPAPAQFAATNVAATPEDSMAPMQSPDGFNVLAQLLAQALQSMPAAGSTARPYDRSDAPLGSVVISGAGLGLPGTRKRFMDPENVQLILRGEQFIELLPESARQEMVNKRITRLVKSEDGSGSFETIEETADVVKLAGQAGPFDLSQEFGVPEKLVEALDLASQIAMAAGLDALHEAGIPLVQTFKRTSKGGYLPDRFMLPEALRDETGIIFASAFPGYDRFSNELKRYHRWEAKRAQLAALEDLREYASDDAVLREIERRIHALREEMRREPYTFDRRFLFRVLSMGHSQFAEYIGARGPNTQVNAACASTAQAVGIAEDWIRTGRCRRVLVIAGDATTSDNLMDWLAAGFLSAGAAATDERVEDAALPFDRRRHGMLTGIGSVALVVESEDAVRERGMRAIAEVLATETANSAFHGTRLDVDHISLVMERLLSSAERRFGINRYGIAAQTVFMSHETFTPARGGSAAAEVTALRRCFGPAADEIVVSNTKGLTGHTMAAGVEDVVAIKALEHGLVPPVPNFRDPDPELGALNLSRGGRYPVQYALRLAAGFGSQISMTLTRRIPGGPDRVDDKARYGRWLADVSGNDRPELEVVQRTLRIKGAGAPQRLPVGSAWQYGTGPAVRAAAPGDVAGAHRPMPMAAVTKTMARAQQAPSVQSPAPALAVGLPGVETRVATEVAETAPREMKESAPVQVAPKPEAEHAGPPTVEEAIPLPPATAGPSVPSAAKAVDPVTPKVLEIVAQKTGYPQDMLELELDLEADLGIDTVKQAETFAAIREAFSIPLQESLSLRDYPTLQSVVGFVYKFRPDLATKSTETRDEAARQAVSSPDMLPSRPSMAAPDPVTPKVLEIVAQKTGYPQDMLELELDLEADLGIDTVKQAETFAAIREAFSIPLQESLSLRDYPTLQSVVGFVYKFRPDLAVERAGMAVTESTAAQTAEVVSAVPFSSPEGAAAPAPPSSAAASPRYTLEDANRIPRRVPVPALRPALDLCKATGVTLAVGSRVVLMQDEGGVGHALEARLSGLGVTVLVLEPGTTAGALEARLTGWLAEGPVQGVYWLPALDREPALEQIDLAGWREVNRRRVKNLYIAMRLLYESVAGPGAFLVSATRLGGQHGYGADGASAPAGGAVSGFTKAYAMEQGLREGTPAAGAVVAKAGGRGLTVKVVDFEADASSGQVAESVLGETLADPGVIEVGYRGGLRYTVTLQERSAQHGGPGLQLGPQTVFLVTGAAGGITSEIVADLACASRGVFYLLDLAGLPARDDRHVALFRQGRDALKAALIDEARTCGEKPTPAAIDRQLAAVERAEAARRAVEAVEAAGGVVHYFSVDLRDAEACAAVIADLRGRYGRLDVFVHAGGLLVDRTLPNKEPAQFDLVFDVKADGWFNLMRAAAGLPIGATVAFSSVAGRFGNNGQTDYSAANDLLCKLTQNLVRTRPGTRGIAIDWTAWGGIGMASRGSVPAVMEALGVDMLPPESGVPTVRRELISGNAAGEVVVAGRLGAWLEERDVTGGLDVEKASAALAARKPRLPLVGKITACKLYGGVEIETMLDPQEQPFLYDHAPDPETPWLPGVMATEALAEAAVVLAPGYYVAAVENVQMLGAFKFFRMEPRTLHLNAVVTGGRGDELVARATLRSVTRPAKEGLPSHVKEHFVADVRLRRNAPTVDKVTFEPPALSSLDTGREDIYQLFFHGPAYQVLESAGVRQVEAVGVLPERMPADVAHREPNGHAILMAPRLIESLFQAAAFWNVRQKGAMAFPLGLGSVTTYRNPESANGKRLYAVVSTPDDGETFDGRVVDDAGEVYVELRGYRTVARPG